MLTFQSSKQERWIIHALFLLCYTSALYPTLSLNLPHSTIALLSLGLFTLVFFTRLNLVHTLNYQGNQFIVSTQRTDKGIAQLQYTLVTPWLVFAQFKFINAQKHTQFITWRNDAQQDERALSVLLRLKKIDKQPSFRA